MKWSNINVLIYTEILFCLTAASTMFLIIYMLIANNIPLLVRFILGFLLGVMMALEFYYIMIGRQNLTLKYNKEWLNERISNICGVDPNDK